MPLSNETYFIFCEEDKDFERLTKIVAAYVREAIKDGCKPSGGASVSSYVIDDKVTYVIAQAMVRE